MRAALSLVAVGLCAQASFGKLQIELAGVHPVKQQNGLRGGFVNALQEATAADTMHQADMAGPSGGDRALQSSRVSEHQAHRELGFIKSYFRVFGFVVNFPTPDFKVTVSINIEISGPGESLFELETIMEVDAEGTGIAETDVDDAFLNDDRTGVCDGCTLTAIAGHCVYGYCEGYDRLNSNNLGASVSGDPHMIGLLGQTINWSGKDNEWYCLISDGSDFHVNVRLSAPMPEDFPDRQLISAVSILTEGGSHSLVVEVKNPYSTITDGCPKQSSSPCLANGGVRVLVDGHAGADLQSPMSKTRFVGGGASPNIVFSSTNLPAECRPFGGDRVWATQFAQMMADQRKLRANTVPFDQWVLQPETLAAPTWCAKFVEEGRMAGLFSTRSEHATLRVETPAADVRINVGVNYQDLVTSPDGTVLVPELEFWQTDLGFDGLQLSGNAAGLMGDTSRVVLDDEGLPVTSGLGALHGPVESYRVAGPLARDFEKLHG